MTVPNLSSIVPSKAKTWVGLIGSLVTFIGPFILSSTDALPAPWPVVIGLVFAVLTALGIYHAPYVPPTAVLAPDTPAVAAASASPPPPAGGYKNPWK